MTLNSPRRTWRESLRVYRNPRVLAMLFLGFSAGLPFPLVAGTLLAWLRTAEVGLSEIGMFGWVGILYSLKFIWAPLADSVRLPGITRWLGRRRSWMLASQVCVTIGLVALASADPSANLQLVAWLALLVAFGSATQDIVVDAYRIEAVPPESQGAMAASYQVGYRVALQAIAGALAFYIADFVSFQSAYLVMAIMMGVGMLTVMLISEPEVNQGKPSDDQANLPPAVFKIGEWFREAVVGPFADFFRQHGYWAFVLLAFIGFYRVSDMVLGVMAYPFYIDLGFSLSEIATVTKVFGVFVTLFGAALGGVAVARYQLAGPLIFGAVMLAVTNLFFAAMAVFGPDLWFLVVTISADNLAAGFTGTVFIAYLSGLTNTAYTATQYALFSSLMTLPGKLVSGFSGFIVESIDWFSFFIYASGMGIPAVILAIIVSRRPVSAA
jgi:PAT family beta-lactamase induction signal transducer AmpG